MKDDVDVRTLLNLDCTLETLEKRLLERGKTSQREDDNRDTIIKRFKTFKESTEPFIKYYQEEVGGCIHTIDGERPIEEVTQVIRKILADEDLIET